MVEYGYSGARRRRSAGFWPSRAWVFLEDVGPAVQVTVRDDGAGFEAGRLEAAARDGRIGVSRSIRGRIEEVGGRCTITSVPGGGTTIEMSVPR